MSVVSNNILLQYFVQFCNNQGVVAKSTTNCLRWILVCRCHLLVFTTTHNWERHTAPCLLPSLALWLVFQYQHDDKGKNSCARWNVHASHPTDNLHNQTIPTWQSMEYSHATLHTGKQFVMTCTCVLPYYRMCTASHVRNVRTKKKKKIASLS